MCCYESKLLGGLVYSRSFGNSFLAIEFVAITIILFQDFGHTNYISSGCGAPWTALFMLMLSNVVIFSSWQDLPMISDLIDEVDKGTKWNKNKKTNLYECSSSLCCFASSTSIVYMLNMCFRFWTWSLWVLFQTKQDTFSGCYSNNLHNMLVETSVVLMIVITCVILYGIVEFCKWCVPATKKCHEDLEAQKKKRDKETNLERVRELELQQKTQQKEYESKLEESKQQAKEAKHQLDETKIQLHETKEQLEARLREEELIGLAQFAVAHVSEAPVAVVVEKGKGIDESN